MAAFPLGSRLCRFPSRDEQGGGESLYASPRSSLESAVLQQPSKEERLPTGGQEVLCHAAVRPDTLGSHLQVWKKGCANGRTDGGGGGSRGAATPAASLRVGGQPTSRGLRVMTFPPSCRTRKAALSDQNSAPAWLFRRERNVWKMCGRGQPEGPSGLARAGSHPLSPAYLTGLL